MIANRYWALYSVQPAVLKKDYRIIIFDTCDEHPFGIGGKGRSHNTQTRDVRKPGVKALRVLRALSPTAANDQPDYDRNRATAPVQHAIPFGRLVDHLPQG